MAQFFNDFMGWCRVKDVVLDRNVFIIELVQEPKRRHVLRTRPITRFAELLGDFLYFKS